MSHEENWPKKDDKAFSDGSRDITACVPWIQMFGLDCLVADAFKGAADMVVEGLKRREYPKSHVDEYLLPVAYLYRHYIELKLKNVLTAGIGLGEIKVDGDVMHGHNLHRLWNHFRQLVLDMKMGDDLMPLHNTEKVVLDFHQLDKSGQAFRYSENKDGARYLENAPQFISLDHLREVMGRVHNFLDGCELCTDAANDAVDAGR